MKDGAVKKLWFAAGDAAPRRNTSDRPPKVMLLFGTRPEAIKLAPVFRGLETWRELLRTVTVCSGQHTDLLYPLLPSLGVRVDHDLSVMRPGQSLNRVCARVLTSLDDLLAREMPDMVVVQGDTTTAFAGALAAFQRGIPVGHVEAGLRSGDRHSPFPEEANRRLITGLATYHFAATTRNRDQLVAEGVNWRQVFVTGNPVVDSLRSIAADASPAPALHSLLERTRGSRRIILTTHRRESFGGVMKENLRVLRRFVRDHEDVSLIFPVHPNPEVVSVAGEVLAGRGRVHLTGPLDYRDFITLLSHAWLIVSDSGGVQEEAPTLGKPLLILRENTERPEAVEAGVARLVGARPRRLAEMLEEAYAEGSWAAGVRPADNPFGRGDSGEQIARIVCDVVIRATEAKRRAG